MKTILELAKDPHYFLSKVWKEDYFYADKTREVLDSLMLIFSVADLKADDLKKAADMRFKDYEDAIQSACATRIKANYIVTRNMKDFSESTVTAIKPAELLDRIWRISTDEGQASALSFFHAYFTLQCVFPL